MKYLGMWVDETFNSKTHFSSRIKLFTLGYHSLKKCGITSDIVSTDVKLCFYKTYIRPMLYYGVENLTLNKTQLKTLQSLEGNLIKGMFRIGKKTRTTPLLRAVNVEKTEELHTRTKINFFKRLTQFELTNKIIKEMKKNDKMVFGDKKSILSDFYEITKTKEDNEMMINAESILNNMVEVCKLEARDQKVKSIKNVLKLVGDERKIGLSQLLKIDFV